MTAGSVFKHLNSKKCDETHVLYENVNFFIFVSGRFCHGEMINELFEKTVQLQKKMEEADQKLQKENEKIQKKMSDENQKLQDENKELKAKLMELEKKVEREDGKLRTNVTALEKLPTNVTSLEKGLFPFYIILYFN